MAKDKGHVLDKVKEGELILVRPYDERDFMILAEFYKRADNHFIPIFSKGSFYTTNLVVLNPLYGSEILPRVSSARSLSDNPYVMQRAMFDHPPKDGYEIPLTPFENSRYYIGLDAILDVLGKTPGYEPHAASLVASRRVLESAHR